MNEQPYQGKLTAKGCELYDQNDNYAGSFFCGFGDNNKDCLMAGIMEHRWNSHDEMKARIVELENALVVIKEHLRDDPAHISITDWAEMIMLIDKALNPPTKGNQ
jgi:hypothetical protein